MIFVCTSVCGSCYSLIYYWRLIEIYRAGHSKLNGPVISTSLEKRTTVVHFLHGTTTINTQMIKGGALMDCTEGRALPRLHNIRFHINSRSTELVGRFWRSTKHIMSNCLCNNSGFPAVPAPLRHLSYVSVAPNLSNFPVYIYEPVNCHIQW